MRRVVVAKLAAEVLSMSRQLHELFLASCGVFGPWSVKISRAERLVEERTFSSPYALVGNSEDASINLPDAQVSRRHAYLQVVPGGVFCIALAGRVGVRWGDKQRASGWLLPSQPVHIGPYALELLPTTQHGWLAPNWARDDPLSECPAAAASYMPVFVEVCEEGQVLAQRKMDRVLALVGRSPRCLFHINHRALSKFQCSLVRTPAGLWLVDLQRRARTSLNGKRVRCARVREGDRVQMGSFSILFRHPHRKVWVIQKVVEETAGVREDTAVQSALVVRPSTEVNQPVGPVRRQPTGLEPARPAGMTAAVAPLPVSPPDERIGAEWSMLVALVNQFNLMQQQLFDQFQESMLMTARVFTTLHQEQMAAVHDELERLRGIADELRVLKEQLNSQQAQVNSAPAMTDQSHASANKGGTQTVLTGCGPGAAGAKATPGQTTAGAPKLPDKPILANSGPTGPCHSDSPQELHIWLNQRISALQEERQSRWQKLLQKILGS
jgi:hypothetical protein